MLRALVMLPGASLCFVSFVIRAGSAEIVSKPVTGTVACDIAACIRDGSRMAKDAEGVEPANTATFSRAQLPNQRFILEETAL